MAKPKSPFTIINRNRDINTKRAEFEVNLADGLKQLSPAMASIFEQLPRPLREAALSSTAPLSPINWVRSLKTALPQQTRLLTQFAEAVKIASAKSKATTVGVLDLGARVSELPKLIERMNRSQDRMVFLEVQTPVPAGMIKTGAPLVAWAESTLGRPLSADEKPDIDRNMLVDEFLTFAESVRKKNELDSLFGITPAMLAFYENGEVHWNYYSYGDTGPLSVVSTYEVRDYSSRAGRPFEAAVGMLIVGQLISTRNNLDFHKESRGCPLDFNENRDELIDGIRSMKFDDKCMAKIADPEEAKAAQALMNALRRMKGETK